MDVSKVHHQAQWRAIDFIFGFLHPLAARHLAQIVTSPEDVLHCFVEMRSQRLLRIIVSLFSDYSQDLKSFNKFYINICVISDTDARTGSPRDCAIIGEFVTSFPCDTQCQMTIDSATTLCCN